MRFVFHDTEIQSWNIYYYDPWIYRTCAMVVPDIELVSEMMLAAVGFIGACLLARKFITFQPLCRELLPEQGCYDWGLHAIKSVLVISETRR